MSLPSSVVFKTILPPWPATWSAPTHCDLTYITTPQVTSSTETQLWLDYPLGDMTCHPPGMYGFGQTYRSPKPTECPLGWEADEDVSITGVHNESTIYRCCSTGWRYYSDSGAPLCASWVSTPTALPPSPRTLTAPGGTIILTVSPTASPGPITALAVEALYVGSSSETDTNLKSSSTGTDTGNTGIKYSNLVGGTNGGLSTGTKIGIGVGVSLIIMILLAIGVFAYWRRRRRRQRERENHGYQKPELDGTVAENFKAELDAVDPRKKPDGAIHELPSPDAAKTDLCEKDPESRAVELPAMPILPQAPVSTTTSLRTDGKHFQQETSVSPITYETSTTWRNSAFAQENEVLAAIIFPPRVETEWSRTAKSTLTAVETQSLVDSEQRFVGHGSRTRTHSTHTETEHASHAITRLMERVPVRRAWP